MPTDEIEALLAQAKRRLAIKTFAAPVLSWLLTGFFFYFALIFSDFGWGLLGILGLTWSFLYGRPFSFYKHQRKKVVVLWNELRASGWPDLSVSDATKKLEGKILQHYFQDPRGEILPIRQAMRLLETHHRQQTRFLAVTERLVELKMLREKIAQLRALGEEHLEAQNSLQRFERDLKSLESVQNALQASCHRLEAILISVEQTAQVRRLHAEISALSAPQNGAIVAHSDHEDLLGIERQIGREIETFLELERETDRHFRHS